MKNARNQGFFRGFAASLLLAMCATTTSHARAGENTTLDVMTFNIRGDFNQGQPTDDPRSWLVNGQTDRKDLVIEIIRDAGPDILGVQEAFRNQVDDLSAAFPEYAFYGVGREDGVAAGEHSGIFYRSDRFELVESDTFWLSNTPDVAGSIFPGAATVRIASWVVLNDTQTDSPLFVLNTHWDHVSQEAREHGANVIRHHLDGLPADLPVIVMGDLNVNEDNAAYQVVLGADAERPLHDAFRTVFPVRGIQEGTFNAFSGASFGARIDHVLHTDAWTATSAAIIRTAFDDRYASDHYPVTVSLTAVPEPAAGTLGIGAAAAVSTRRSKKPAD